MLSCAGIVVSIIFITLLSAYVPFFKVTDGEKIQEQKKIKPALLVVDVQEGLSGSLSTKGYQGYADQSEALISSLNKVIDQAVLKGVPVIYVYHEDTHPVIQYVTQSHMASGAPGTAIDKRVKIVSKNRFNKNIMDGFSNPKLHQFLRAENINKLYMTGLDAAFCVYRTSRAAKKRNYQVALIKDAVISSSKPKKERMLKKYHNHKIMTLTVKDFTEN